MESFSIGIICGGPSPERGISLNSARSITDHIISMGFDVKVFYVNTRLEFFLIDRAQLYSNTPSDFDFKLSRSGKKLPDPTTELKKVNIVFPVIHGKYGEDGTLQSFLESNNIPFVGSSSNSCKQMFSKSNINTVLKRNSFDVTNLIEIDTQNPDEVSIQRFLKKFRKAILKPNSSGSSICVSSVSDIDEVMEGIDKIREIDNKAVLEEKCEGSEFAVIVLQKGDPVALVPTEIDTDKQIFDYRKKYLPTNTTRWFCPPRFNEDITQKIMKLSEDVFRIFRMNDFVRIDGWLLDNGRVVFSDINPISGLEQNSFLFQQSSWMGMTHQDILEMILRSACNRYGIDFPTKKFLAGFKPVYVLFGGDSAERQVSLMSGTNVWLKLLSSKNFKPLPCLLDGENVWYLPYQYTMNHTVEEIKDNCEDASRITKSLEDYKNDIQQRLGLNANLEMPQKVAVEEFLQDVKNNNGFIFLALHGGIGEDGTIQGLLESHNIKYNGSDSSTSSLCMNKYNTGKITVEGIESLKKILCRIENGKLITDGIKVTFDLLSSKLLGYKFIIKPCSDGCSAGVIKLASQGDIDRYVEFISSSEISIPAGTLSDQENIVELPKDSHEYIIEAFIEIDEIKATDDKLIIEEKSGWVEMTVGITESMGKYHSLNPSITVAVNSVLSVEEKFQGGTGINLTPPPNEIISSSQLKIIKAAIENCGKAFKIKNYARVDIFFNRITNKIILIEINTLPALTPSTVIFHQALSEDNPMYPIEFLESLILNRISE